MSVANEKIQEVSKELSEWVSKPTGESFHFTEPVAKAQGILSEPKLKKSVMVALKSINTWYAYNYTLQGLTDEQLPWRKEYFASCYYIPVMFDIFAKLYPGNPGPFPMTTAVKYLALTLQAKWYDKSDEIRATIQRGLSSKLYNGGLDYSKAAWFILTLTDQQFDFSATRKPKSLGVYDEVLTKWDTKDLAEVDRLVTVLANHHANEAGFDEAAVNEFSFYDEYVTTYEIAAWLSFRERNGLANPSTYSHELMQLPINKVPAQPLPFTPLPLFEEVLDKLKKEADL